MKIPHRHLMLRVHSPKMAEPRRLSLGRHAKFHIFSTIFVAAIFLTYIFSTETFTFTYTPTNATARFHGPLVTNRSLFVNRVETMHEPIEIVREEVVVQEALLGHNHNQNQSPLVPPINLTKKQRLDWFRRKLPEFDIMKSTKQARRFEGRARAFLDEGRRCEVRFFMTWISSSAFRVFGEREFLAVDSLFNSNPKSCLIILSNAMDSVHGFEVLKPLVDLGFRVRAMTPDLDFLFKNTPAESWFDHIKNGKRDPGEIPLAQNLSNLIRLAVLYKYGGVYLDTDFVTLKDFDGLKNSIGAQSATKSGNWTRLNNAVLIFDKNHPLLYRFMEEFSLTFDGNKWGHNGPYLVSRVVERVSTAVGWDFTVLPPKAFYPVDWTRIDGFFKHPVNRVHQKWIQAKVAQLTESSYGVHLWNKQSSKLRIEQGSIMEILVSRHCVICRFLVDKSQRFSENSFIIS